MTTAFLKRLLVHPLILSAALLLPGPITALPAWAETAPESAAPPAEQAPEPLSAEELEILVARIALYRQSVAPEVAAGAWTVLWQGGVARGGVIKRNVAIPDIPTFEEAFQAITGAAPTGPSANFVRWHARAQAVTRFAALPRGAPARATEVLVEAWRRMAADPEFQREADATLGISPDAMAVGEEARAAIASVIVGPDALVPH